MQGFLSHDIPFKRDDAHRLLPAMIACLVGFAALLLALAMTLTGALNAQSRQMSGMLQVEITSPRTQKKLLDNVVSAIQATPGVTQVAVLEREEMQALLKPLLGTQVNFDDLPLPTLVDIQTRVEHQKTTVDVPALKERLQQIDAGIVVHERGPWMNRMVRAVAVVQAVVIGVAVLLLACVLGMIMLVAKTNLRLHFKTVRLLHMFGATDEYILKQFQRNSAVLAGRGACIGVGVVATLFFLLVYAAQQGDTPLLPGFSFGFAHLLVFLALPVFTALTSLLATRFTVQSMLQQMH